VQKLEHQVRQLAGELIDEVNGRGHCEVLRPEIGATFRGATVHRQMADAPLADRELLVVAKVDRFTRAPDIKERLAALGELGDYLKGLIGRARARAR